MVVMEFSTRHDKGGGEAGAEGQSQRRSAPRGLGAEDAEAAAGDTDVAEAHEASAESGAGADLGPRPADWATRTQNQKKNWIRAQKKQQRK